MARSGSHSWLLGILAGLVVAGLSAAAMPAIAQSPQPGGASDLDVFALASPHQVGVGGEVVVYVTVTNSGPDAATGITVATSGVDENLVALGGTGASCAVVDGAISCDVADLGVGEAVRIDARFDVLDDGEHVVHAQVTADQPDPHGGNDSSLARFRAVIPGDVFGWGWNGSGELGEGLVGPSFGHEPLPVRSIVVERAVQLDGYGHDVVAVDSTGEVWAWGYQPTGMVTTTVRRTPARLAGLSDIIQVEAGGYTYAALARNGTVWTWGVNRHASLGTGDPEPSFAAVPTAVLGLPPDIVSIAMSANGHALALAADGGVWSWGANSYGQLGTGDFSEAATAVRAVPDLRATIISAAHNYSAAVDAAGDVWMWGENLGSSGTPSTCGIPDTDGCHVDARRVDGLANVVDVALGDEFALARTDSGQLLSWGRNCWGLGRPVVGCTQSLRSPAFVDIEADVVALSAGNTSAIVTTDDGTAWAWGRNYDATAGDGTREERISPVAVQCIDRVQDVTADISSSFAIIDPDRERPDFSGFQVAPHITANRLVRLFPLSYDLRTCLRLMRVSNSPAVDSTGALVHGVDMPYGSGVQWDILDPATGGHAAPGNRTVYIQTRDRARNWSFVWNDVLTYLADNVPPSVTGLPEREPDANVGSSRVDLQACKLEYSIVSPK